MGDSSVNTGVIRIAGLVLASGLCALVYQVAWLRELRLVFGGSTAASAAVLAIFMGGLGLGSARLGKRADEHAAPLRFYSNLEMGIAVSAAISPFLLSLVREIYIALGGSMALGLRGATLVRLLLTSLVLGVPTFLMGATLPAVARAAESNEDRGRHRVAFLYGANTLGAVVGAFIATFYLLEIFGTRSTLWLACGLNVIVAVMARALSRTLSPTLSPTPSPAPISSSKSGDASDPQAPPWFILSSAAVVGFAFLLMELVWYRMLSPLLGGSTYTFGLILSLALLGIGAGSLTYALLSARARPTLRGFAFTVALEAMFMAIPYALGDRVAILTHVLRELAAFGFFGHVFGWTIITAIVVLPAAFISGYQFPMLIGLLGAGRTNVGRHTGFAYAFNTTGAILGSLVGGFGILPMLGATSTWKAVVLLLAMLATAALIIDRPRRSIAGLLKAGPAIVVAMLMITLAIGPTAVWRHGGIGVGRSALSTDSRNEMIKSMLDLRRELVWERDGIESSVGLQVISGVSFLINGKNDGNARFDASTQVTLGLLSAMFHQAPKQTFVIGMGTGSTAGWLAAVDTMEHVDVAELEPATTEMVLRSAAVNHDVLNDPKVNVIAGDARELLLTAPKQYDLIVSEPSNPYRAGISSLYTVEFYEAAKERLNEGGIFSQWVQAYEISTDTFRTIYATISSVFEYVESWQTNDLDLLLLCSSEPIRYDEHTLRQRIQQEPFASALMHTWFVTDLEGLFSRYVANATLPKQVVAQEGGRLNTDDRTLVEYGFARTVGQDLTFSANELRNSAFDFGAMRPLTLTGDLDWERVEEQRFHMSTLMDHNQPNIESHDPELAARLRAMSAYIKGDLEAVRIQWNRQSREPEYYLELALVAEALADEGDANCVRYIQALEAIAPLEAMAIDARFLYRRGHTEQAVQRLIAVYESMRENAWPLHAVMQRAVKLAQEIATADKTMAPRLLEAMRQPFAVAMHEEVRKEMTVDLASQVGLEAVIPLLEEYEPNVIWNEEFLNFRATIYEMAGHPLAKKAQAQLVYFNRHEPEGFKEVMEAKSPAPIYNAQLDFANASIQPRAEANANHLGQE